MIHALGDANTFFVSVYCSCLYSVDKNMVEEVLNSQQAPF